MPDNKGKVAVQKKDTIAKKKTTTPRKKSAATTKTVTPAIANKTKEKNVSKVSTQKKVTASNKKDTKSTNKSKVANSDKRNTLKDTKKKAIPKISTSTVIQKESNKELNKNKKQKKIIGKEKVNLNKIREIKSNLRKNKTKKTSKSSKVSIFVTVKEKLGKIGENLHSLKNKTKKSKKEKKVTVAKTSKNKKQKKSGKVKAKQIINAPILTNKTKKWLIVVAVLCATIILVEIGYLIYHKIDLDRRTTYYDSLNSLVVDDTDVVMVGSSNFKYSKYYDYTNGLEKAKLIKYDKNGKIIFEKMYDKGINTTFSSIICVDDGYVVVGSGEFSEEEHKDGAREAIIVKYDKDGNIVWEKYYQVVTNTRFNKVIATSDGYIAIGQSIYANMEMGNHTTGGGIIVKYDLEGNEVWHNNHGGMKSGNFNDIVEVNGDFYVVGKDATDSGNVVKYNKDGKYQWHRNYSYTDGIGFTGVTYLDNALYVVGSKKILPEGTGDEDNRDTTNTDALLVKYDLNGKILFEKIFGGSNYERYNSILSYRNNFYIVGHTTSKDAGLKINTDGELMTGILVRYDIDGNILKKERLGGSNNDNLTDIVTDGVSIYVSGYSNSDDGNISKFRDNGKDYFGKLIKLDFKFKTLLVK